MRVIYWLDFHMLFGVWWVRDFLHGWLSLPFRRFEQLLWLGYVVPQTVYAVVHRQGWLLTAVDIWIATSMWSAMETSDSHRLRQLFSVPGMFYRLLMVGVSAWVWSIYCWGYRARGDAFFAIAETGLAVFILAITLARNGEPGGRKRKLALEKLKAMFGTSWMPVPGAARTAREVA